MGDPEKPFFPAEASGGPPRGPHHGAVTPEAKLWRSFRNSQLASGLPNAVTHLDFSPAPPHDLAASSSASVLLFDGGGGGGNHDLTSKPFSPITHFPDLAYSPSFRPVDGSLLAAGDHSGLVLLFDPNRSRPPLCRLRAHSRPARVVRFLSRTHLFSAGDDAAIQLWDISASSSPLVSLPSAHKDYVRAGAPSPSSPDLLASASYDHHVKLWDLRSPSSPIAEFSHGAPVESLLFLPSGVLLATAGGNSVKLWDAVGGFRLLHSMESHNKTVTSICLARLPRSNDAPSRLLSVSLDGYLKVFDFASLKVTHSTRYPSMLLSVASSPSGLLRAVGTSNGIIYVAKKQRKKTDADEIGGIVTRGAEISGAKPVLRPTNYRYFHRGQSEKPREGDYLVKKAPRVKLAEHDRLLKKFRHREALVSALGRRDNPAGVVAVMEELVSRRKLMRCVGNLDVGELGMLLAFLHKYATMPTHARFLMNLARKVIQMRFEDIRRSEEMKVHVRNLKRMVAEEIKIQVSLQELKGMLSPLVRLAAR